MQYNYVLTKKIDKILAIVRQIVNQEKFFVFIVSRYNNNTNNHGVKGCGDTNNCWPYHRHYHEKGQYTLLNKRKRPHSHWHYHNLDTDNPIWHCHKHTHKKPKRDIAYTPYQISNALNALNINTYVITCNETKWVNEIQDIGYKVQEMGKQGIITYYPFSYECLQLYHKYHPECIFNYGDSYRPKLNYYIDILHREYGCKHPEIYDCIDPQALQKQEKINKIEELKARDADYEVSILNKFPRLRKSIIKKQTIKLFPLNCAHKPKLDLNNIIEYYKTCKTKEPEIRKLYINDWSYYKALTYVEEFQTNPQPYKYRRQKGKNSITDLL